MSQQFQVNFKQLQLEHIDRLIEGWLGAHREPDIGEAVRDIFEREFWLNDWAPLARWTQQERYEQGFDPHEPILVRTGRYRKTWIDPNDPFHVSDVGFSGFSWVLSEGSQDPRAERLTYGDPFRRLPPRSPMPEEGEEGLVTEAVYDSLSRVLERVLGYGT